MDSILQIKPLLQIRGERLDAFAKVRGTLNCKKRLSRTVNGYGPIYGNGDYRRF